VGSPLSSADVAHLIQVALTPIFLISAIAATLNVLTGRLARVVDRARTMEQQLLEGSAGRDLGKLHHLLEVAARRAYWINVAITLTTVSALFIALLVVLLFLNAFVRGDLSTLIACLFILSMVAFAAALTAFLIEVRIATATLRIGIEEASRQGE
jgi:hypothetical protein